MLKALIFDVDGTLADTEEMHLEAFNEAFKEVGLDWHWTRAQYASFLEVAGGKERIIHFWKMHDPELAMGAQILPTVQAIHQIKTQNYEKKIHAGKLSLRPGVKRLLSEAHAAGLKLAIATTTTTANVVHLLNHHFGDAWQAMFSVICDGSAPVPKKPAPDIYLLALHKLQLAAEDCIAFEDSMNGLLAAQGAGLRTVITPTAYTLASNFEHAWLQLPHLGDETHPLDQTQTGLCAPWLDLVCLTRLLAKEKLKNMHLA